MNHYPCPTVLSITGSDNMGKTGIQSDITAITALGAYAATVLSAIGIRNKEGIKATHVIPPEIIRDQIEYVMENMWPDVVKIGLIGDVESAKIIADCLRKYHPKYVVYDPSRLIPASSNVPDNDTIKIIKNELLRYVNLMIIDLPEAKAFTATTKVTTKNELKNITHALTERYSIPVVVKGGNILETSTCDILHIPDGETYEYIGNKISAQDAHQASSVFSAGIATFLALGEKLNTAVEHARAFVDKITSEDIIRREM